LMAQGKRRYDRKQSGYGGQTKPVFHKKAKTVSLALVGATPSRGTRGLTRGGLSSDWLDVRRPRRSFFDWSALPARPRSSSSSSDASSTSHSHMLCSWLHGTPPLTFHISHFRLQLRVGRREEDPWCRLDFLNVSPSITRRGSAKFGRESCSGLRGGGLCGICKSSFLFRSFFLSSITRGPSAAACHLRPTTHVQLECVIL
jgi:hypothetical protein